jgi:eukaryotic-like serine/threonine-protein kinase
MDPYIGKYLDDRYEILDVLGTGGMAVVYRAYCHRLNRYVAVKILKSELAGDEDLRRRFHDESQAVAMLSHPNIVGVFDVSQVDGREFIVMELIDGITLKQYMRKRGGCLNWREALHFISQIMQGLKHAHSRGIIHRDIKPQNIMVLRDGSVKVTDFGIARSTNSQATVTQEAIGSVHYISPEQAKGSHIDARSDIYSAGVVLYEMLTGRLPFEGDNPVAVAIQHINSIPVPPKDLNPEIPLGMEQITMKAMAGVLDRRYASAEAMLEDLEAFRKNPEIDFGYGIPGAVAPDEDEPTMIRRSGSFLEEDNDPDATVRAPIPGQNARFEREPEPEQCSRSKRRQEEDYDDDYDDYDDYSSKRRTKRSNKRFIGIACGIIAAILILFVVLWFAVLRNLSSSSSEVYVVPKLIGQTIEEAQATIDGDDSLKGHFTITATEYASSEEYEAGVIIKQSPEENATTRQETTEIKVTISSGPAPEDSTEITLDDYSGQDYRLVKSKLEDLGFTTRCEAEYSDTVEEGKVVRTDPASSKTVTKGTQITIYYSQGPEQKTVAMVNLLNLTESDARNAISQLGLQVGTVSTEYSDEYAEGRVCYQSIPEKTEVDLNSTVNLIISLGKQTTQTTDTTKTDTTTGGSTQTTDTTQTTSSAYLFDIPLPSDRTSNVTVVLTVNGKQVESQSIPSSYNEDYIQVEYEGTVSSYSVTIDGSDVTSSVSMTKES